MGERRLSFPSQNKSEKVGPEIGMEPDGHVATELPISMGPPGRTPSTQKNQRARRPGRAGMAEGRRGVGGYGGGSLAMAGAAWRQRDVRRGGGSVAAAAAAAWGRQPA
jgi:hypothetical protein